MPRPIAIALAFILAAPAGLRAHDIPNDVIVQAFLKPDGQRLQLLVRVPLEAMRDVDVPQRDKGYLDWRAPTTRFEPPPLSGSRGSGALRGRRAIGAPELIDVRVSLPSDTSFREYATALAHLRGPKLPADTDLYWEQGVLDAWLEYPITSDQSRFAINPGLRTLAQRVTIALRLVTPDGRVRHSSCTTIPGSSGSTPGGTRPRDASCDRVSATS